MPADLALFIVDRTTLSPTTLAEYDKAVAIVTGEGTPYDSANRGLIDAFHKGNALLAANRAYTEIVDGMEAEEIVRVSKANGVTMYLFLTTNHVPVYEKSYEFNLPMTTKLEKKISYPDVTRLEGVERGTLAAKFSRPAEALINEAFMHIIDQIQRTEEYIKVDSEVVLQTNPITGNNYIYTYHAENINGLQLVTDKIPSALGIMAIVDDRVKSSDRRTFDDIPNAHEIIMFPTENEIDDEKGQSRLVVNTSIRVDNAYNLGCIDGAGTLSFSDRSDVTMETLFNGYMTHNTVPDGVQIPNTLTNTIIARARLEQFPNGQNWSQGTEIVISGTSVVGGELVDIFRYTKNSQLGKLFETTIVKSFQAVKPIVTRDVVFPMIVNERPVTADQNPFIHFVTQIPNLKSHIIYGWLGKSAMNTAQCLFVDPRRRDIVARWVSAKLADVVHFLFGADNPANRRLFVRELDLVTSGINVVGLRQVAIKNNVISLASRADKDIIVMLLSDLAIAEDGRFRSQYHTF